MKDENKYIFFDCQGAERRYDAEYDKDTGQINTCIFKDDLSIIPIDDVKYHSPTGAIIPLRLDTVIFDPCRRKYNISYEIEITPDTII